MKRWKSILGVLVVFLLGTLAGAAVEHRVGRQRLDAVLFDRGGGAADLIVRRLTRSLDLDSAQQEKVRAIVSETHRDIVEIRRPVQGRIDAAIERSRARVREILRPGQQEKFDRIRAERRMRRGRPR